MPHPFSSQPGARHWSQKGCLAQDAIESFSVGTAFRTSWLMYRRSSHSRCLANTSHVIHLCSPPHGGLHHPLYHCEPCHLAIHTQPECRCHMAAPVTWWQRLPWVLSDEVEFGGHFLNWCQQGPLALVLRAWGNFCPQRASSCSLFFCCSFWHSRLPFALDPGGRCYTTCTQHENLQNYFFPFCSTFFPLSFLFHFVVQFFFLYKFHVEMVEPQM